MIFIRNYFDLGRLIENKFETESWKFKNRSMIFIIFLSESFI